MASPLLAIGTACDTNTSNGAGKEKRRFIRHGEKR
jgi:hypothetical protein